MNLNTNAATTIAALLVLNAGLFVSNHTRVARANAPAMQADAAHASAEACRAKAEAHTAALQARLEARRIVREATQARIEAQRDAARAAVMAPANSTHVHTSVTDYVRCIIVSGVRTLAASN
jgi:hypothetical protein